MADRQALTQDQKFTAWQREVNDRIGQLERRKVQGDLALDTLHMNGATSLPASPTTPLALRSPSAQTNWTAALTGLASTPNVNGGDALVYKRDSDGEVVDMVPRPFVQYAGLGAQAIATGAAGTVVTTWAASFSAPYSPGDTLIGGGVIQVPTDGLYNLNVNGTWAGVADATYRFLAIQFSTGGAFATLFTVSCANTGAVAIPCGQNISMPSGLRAGWLLRVLVAHGSATTPLNFTGGRFAISYFAGILP